MNESNKILQFEEDTFSENIYEIEEDRYESVKVWQKFHFFFVPFLAPIYVQTQ